MAGERVAYVTMEEVEASGTVAQEPGRVLVKSAQARDEEEEEGSEGVKVEAGQDDDDDYEAEVEQQLEASEDEPLSSTDSDEDVVQRKPVSSSSAAAKASAAKGADKKSWYDGLLSNSKGGGKKSSKKEPKTEPPPKLRQSEPRRSSLSAIKYIQRFAHEGSSDSDEEAGVKEEEQEEQQQQQQQQKQPSQQQQAQDGEGEGGPGQQRQKAAVKAPVAGVDTSGLSAAATAQALHWQYLALMWPMPNFTYMEEDAPVVPDKAGTQQLPTPVPEGLPAEASVAAAGAMQGAPESAGQLQEQVVAQAVGSSGQQQDMLQAAGSTGKAEGGDMPGQGGQAGVQTPATAVEGAPQQQQQTQQQKEPVEGGEEGEDEEEEEEEEEEGKGEGEEEEATSKKVEGGPLMHSGATANGETRAVPGSEATDPAARPMMRYWGPCGAMAAACAEEDAGKAMTIVYGGSIQVDLISSLQWLRQLARYEAEPSTYNSPGLSLGAPAAAVLRFKEATQLRSNLHRYGEIGIHTRVALEGCGPGVAVPARTWRVPPPSANTPIALLRTATPYSKPPGSRKPPNTAARARAGQAVGAAGGSSARKPVALKVELEGDVAHDDAGEEGVGAHSSSQAQHSRRRAEAARARAANLTELNKALARKGQPGGDGAEAAGTGLDGDAADGEGRPGKQARAMAVAAAGAADREEEHSGVDMSEESEATMSSDVSEDSETGDGKLRNKLGNLRGRGRGRGGRGLVTGRGRGRGSSAAAGTRGGSSTGDGEDSGGEGEVEEDGQSTQGMVEVDFKKYTDRLPATEASFQASYQRWQGDKNFDYSQIQPVLGAGPWRPFILFRLVAEHGGYQAVTDAGKWRDISNAWQDELDATQPLLASQIRMPPKEVEKNYRTLLLGLEQHVSMRAEVERKPVEVGKGEQGRRALQRVQQATGEGLGLSPGSTLGKKRKLNEDQSKRGVKAKTGKPANSNYLDDFNDLADTTAIPVTPVMTPAPAVAVMAPSILLSGAKPAGVPMISTAGVREGEPGDSGGSQGPSPGRGRGRGRGSRGGGRNGEGGGGLANRPGYDINNKRRVLIKFPEGVLLPNDQRSLAILRRVVPELTPAQVFSNHSKFIISVDMPGWHEGLALKKVLQDQAPLLFAELRLEPNCDIRIGLVQATSNPRPRNSIPPVPSPLMHTPVPTVGLGGPPMHAAAVASGRVGIPGSSAARPYNNMLPIIPGTGPSDPYSAPVDPRRAQANAAAAAVIGPAGGYPAVSSSGHAPLPAGSGSQQVGVATDPRRQMAGSAPTQDAAALAALAALNAATYSGNGAPFGGSGAQQGASAGQGALPPAAVEQLLANFYQTTGNVVQPAQLASMLQLMASQGGASGLAALQQGQQGAEPGQYGQPLGQGVEAGIAAILHQVGLLQAAQNQAPHSGGAGVQGILDPIQPLTLNQHAELPMQQYTGHHDESAAAAAAAAAAVVASSTAFQNLGAEEGQGGQEGLERGGLGRPAAAAELNALLATLQGSLPSN